MTTSQSPRAWLVVAFASVLITSSAARADEASHKKAVLEFFAISGMESMMQQSIDAMLELQIKSNPALGQFESVLRKFLTKYMSWKSLEPEFVTIYMKAFSEDDFKQLLAFYKTPVGKRALQQMPKLMQQGAEIGANRVQAHMAELQQQIAAQAQAGAAQKQGK